MLYILRTYTTSPYFGICLNGDEGQYTSVRANEYEGRAEPQPSILVSDTLSIRILTESVEFASRAEHYELESLGGMTSPEMDSLPDFYMRDPIPLVSERFKSLIEDHDDMRHQLYPVKIQRKENDIITDEQVFYFFVCCRLVQLTKSACMPENGTIIESGALPSEDVLRRLKTVQDNPDIQSILSKFPICRDYDNRSIHYLNECFLHACQDGGLKGFNLSENTSNGFIRRDVGYVKY